MVPEDPLDPGRSLARDCGRNSGAAGPGGGRRRGHPLLRSRHDRRHQRAHHRRHGGHRPHRDRGVSRHPGDPSPAPTPQLRHPDPEASAPRAAPPPARDEGTHLSLRAARCAARPRRAGRDPRRLSRRRGGGGGRQLPAQLPQAGPRGRGGSRGARRLSRRLRLRIARSGGRVPGVRANHDDGAECVPGPGREPLPRAPRGADPRHGHRDPEDPSIPRRGRLAPGGGRDGGPVPDVGAGRGASPGPAFSPAGRSVRTSSPSTSGERAPTSAWSRTTGRSSRGSGR